MRVPRRRPLVVAHRGASAYAPEDTLEAAELAWQAGADAWELDVRLTRDGFPVVIHDDSLLRTTDVLLRFPGDPRSRAGYLVADFDRDEIRALDAGAWFLTEPGGFRSAGWFGTRRALSQSQVSRWTSGQIRVPTLGECLALTRRLDWLVNVEVKSGPVQDYRLLLAVLRELDHEDLAERVLVSSFDHTAVAQAAASGLPLATGVLTMNPIADAGRYVRSVVGADCYHASAESLGAGDHQGQEEPASERLHAELIRDLHQAGLPVLVFTVNDARPEGLARRLAEAGVSGLFTDDPTGLCRLFGVAPRTSRTPP